MPTTGLLLCDDLIFASRITGTARALGLEMRSARSLDALLKQSAEQAAACVIVDLQHPGLDVAALVGSLKQQGAGKIVAYGSHVAAEALRLARAAGCDVVLSRSQFVEALPKDLPAWYGEPGNSNQERCVE